ncbi:MAG TPA: Ig-like domain-containing protein [Acidimicrobiales bacterium]|nr:Ig-like domain-containing protein [Acidimicrobiales bacterium]
MRVLQNREPVRDVHVRFGVASGGGGVSGGDVETDSLGIATVFSWMLGARAGVNTMVAVALPDSEAPVLFTATGTAGPLAKLTAATPVSEAATVGQPVPTPPAVRATDAYDNPVRGTAVTFTVTSGGGTATGTSATSDTLGLAAVGGWTLGTVTGSNTMSASAASLPSVNFVATGLAGPPASITKTAGDSQTANLQSPVDTAPAVMVRDAFRNPVAGAAVTFTVTSGGGALAGPSQATDSAGVARAGAWTLGAAAGANALVASVAGLPTVTFTATAVDFCGTAEPYALGASISGTLTVTDCRLASGQYADVYSTSAASGTRVRLQMASTTFLPSLNLLDAGGSRIASQPYSCGAWDVCGDSIRVLLGAGTYVLQAGGYDFTDYNEDSITGGTGPYVLSSAALPEDEHSCTGEAPTFVTPGVTTQQRVDSTDCVSSFRSFHYYFDQFLIYMMAGRTYTISMSSTEFDTYLDLRVGDWGPGTLVASSDDAGGSSNSQIAYVAPASGLYVIEPATYQPDTTGSYTLTVTANGAPSSPVRIAPRAGASPAVRTPRRSSLRVGEPAFTPRPPKAQRGG